MEIYFGAKVTCQDGTIAGDVRRVIVDTNSREVTNVVLGQTTAPGERMVPVSLIQSASERDMQVRARSGDIAGLDLYLPERFGITDEIAREVSAEGGRSEPQTASESSGERGQAIVEREARVAIGDDCQVEALDGKLGVLAGVRLDLYANQLFSLILRRGFEKQVDIPAEWITEITPGVVRLGRSITEAGKAVGHNVGPYLPVEGEEEDTGGGRV